MVKLKTNNETYSTKITEISKKDFTKREIDIIACLLCSRAALMPSFLSISPRTMETHIHNIMLKIGCNYREGIIDFIERSDKLALIKDHYQSLVLSESFKTCLQNILTMKKKTVVTCHIVHDESLLKAQMLLIDELKKNLTSAGIDTLLIPHNKTKTLSDLREELHAKKDTYTLCILSNQNAEGAAHFYQKHIERVKGKSSNILFVEIDHTAQSNGENDFSAINISKGDTYYKNILDILKHVLKNDDLNTIISEFNAQETITSTTTEHTKSGIWSQRNQPSHERKQKQTPIPPKIKHIKSIAALACLSIFVLTFLLFSHKTNINQKVKFQPIQTDLLIPAESAFLYRPLIIKRMEEKLHSNNNLQDIALVGIVGPGGAGKTTLARYYGKTHPSMITWEINAETQESLFKSFKDLAYALAKTSDERNELVNIEKNQNRDEKEKQLLAFVKERLQSVSNWLLIYDNVENVGSLKIYFPHDARAWGSGKVIITTRDANLTSSSYIKTDNVIDLEELSPKETFTLFYKIMHDHEPKEIPAEESAQIKNFLTHIPPFPLDVSIAAYYIKNAKISYDQYLKRIDQYAQTLDANQESLLKEVSDYTKTRYKIVKLSFEKLIELNPEYKEFLFSLCLIDSQEIPQNIFNFQKEPALIDHMMRDLKKYSLISIKESTKEKKKDATFSIHRSTQTIGRKFLLSLLTATEKKSSIELLTGSLDSFYEYYVEKTPQSVMLLVPHLNALIETVQTLPIPQDVKDNATQDALYTLGYTHLRVMRNMVLEKECFTKAYNLQQKTHHFQKKKLATLLRKLCEVCADLQFTEDAIFYAEESNRIYRELPDSEIKIADNYYNIAQSYMEKNDFEKAKSNVLEGIKIISPFDSPRAKESHAQLYSQLAWIYSATFLKGDKAEEAKKYIHKALHIMGAEQTFHTTNPKSHKKTSCLVARLKEITGEIHCRAGNYDEALHLGLKDAQYIIDNSLDSCAHHLLKGWIANDMGEVYLRQGNLKDAKEKILDSLRIAERVTGKSSVATLIPLVLCAETRARLGELNEAYEDCLATFKIEKRSHTNYSNLMALTAHYLAAVIKFKQGDLEKSKEHLTVFFEKTKPFCDSFLTQEAYQVLNKNNTFAPLKDEMKTKKDMAALFHRCTDIYTSIYGTSHPFVRDFVSKNSQI